jgi:hypothetical protein
MNIAAAIIFSLSAPWRRRLTTSASIRSGSTRRGSLTSRQSKVDTEGGRSSCSSPPGRARVTTPSARSPRRSKGVRSVPTRMRPPGPRAGRAFVRHPRRLRLHLPVSAVLALDAMPLAGLGREQRAWSSIDEVGARLDACFSLDDRQPGSFANLVVA